MKMADPIKQPKFDLNGALKSGVSVDEIKNLFKEVYGVNYDLKGALNAGISTDEIMKTIYEADSRLKKKENTTSASILEGRKALSSLGLDFGKPQEFNKPASESTSLNIPKETSQQSEVKQLGRIEKEKVRNEAVENTLSSYLKSIYGNNVNEINSDPLSQKEKKRKELVQQLNNGELFVTQSKINGKPILARSSTNIINSFMDGFNEAFEKENKDQYFASLPIKDKINYVKTQNELAKNGGSEYLPEVAKGTTSGGILNTVLSYGSEVAKSVGEITQPLMKAAVYGIHNMTVGRAFGGGAAIEGALANNLNKSGAFISFAQDMGFGSYTDATIRNFNKLKQQNPKLSDEEAMNIAEKGGMIAAGAGVASAAILSEVMPSLSKEAKIINTEGFQKGLDALVKQTTKETAKMSAVAAGQSVITDLGSEATGVHIPIQEVINNASESVKSMAVIPLAMGAISGALQVPKWLNSQALNVVSQLPREKVMNIYRKAESIGLLPEGKSSQIEAKLIEFDNAKNKVPKDMPEEHIASLSGLQIIKDKLVNEKEKLDPKYHDEINAKIKVIDDKIDKIKNSSEPISHENDDITGMPVIEREKQVPEIIRHGETDANINNVLIQSETEPLNKTGKRQAELKGLELKDKNINEVITSPLTRSKETADIIANNIGENVPVTIMHELQEHKPNESTIDFANRIKKANEKLSELGNDKAVVTHGSVMKMMDALHESAGDVDKAASIYENSNKRYNNLESFKLKPIIDEKTKEAQETQNGGQNVEQMGAEKPTEENSSASNAPILSENDKVKEGDLLSDGRKVDFVDENKKLASVVKTDENGNNIRQIIPISEAEKLKIEQDATKEIQKQEQGGTEQGSFMEHSGIGEERQKEAQQGANNSNSGEGSEGGINVPPTPPNEQADINNSSDFNKWVGTKMASLGDIKQSFRKVGIQWNGMVESALNKLMNLAKKIHEETGAQTSMYDVAKEKMIGFLNELKNIEEGTTNKATQLQFSSEDQVQMHFLFLSAQKLINDIKESGNTSQFSEMLLIDALNTLENTKSVYEVMRSASGYSLGFGSLESTLDPTLGYRVKELQAIKNNNGVELNEKQKKLVAEQWEKEKELILKEQELNERILKEQYNKKIEELTEELKQKSNSSSNKPTSKLFLEKDKTIVSKKIREIGEKIKNSNFGKANLGDDVQKMGFGIDANKILGDALIKIADLIDAGKTLLDAIDEYAVQHLKTSDIDIFKKDIVKLLDNFSKRDEIFNEIEKIAKANYEKDISQEMVDRKLIDKYVQTFLGEFTPEEIPEQVKNNLSTILPDITTENVIHSIARIGEFAEMPKEKVNSILKDLNSEYRKFTLLQKKLDELTNELHTTLSGDISSESKGKSEKLNLQIKDLKEQIKKALASQGKRQVSVIQEIRKEYHNIGVNLNGVVNNIKNIINGITIGNENEINTIRGINDILKESSYDYPENVKVSQVDKINEIIKNFKKILEKIDEHKGEKEKLKQVSIEINVAISNAEEALKLEGDKLSLKNKINGLKNKILNYERKIRLSEDLNEPTKYNNKLKSNSELLKLQIEKKQIQTLYEKKIKDASDFKNLGFKDYVRLFQSSLVAGLIYKFPTFLNVLSSGIVRPFSERGTKASVIPFFEKMFPEIALQAKKGGEDVPYKIGYLAQFSNLSDKKIEEIQQKYSVKSDETKIVYNEQKSILDGIQDKNSNEYKQQLKNFEKARKEYEISAAYNIGLGMFSFIGGKTYNNALNILLKGVSQIEEMFGDWNKETLHGYGKKETPEYIAEKNKLDNIEDKSSQEYKIQKEKVDELYKNLESIKPEEAIKNTVQNLTWLLDIFGRIHSAEKEFSGRAAFADGFMSRVMAEIKDGNHNISASRLLEIANDTYINDYTRGKYQQKNLLTYTGNKLFQLVSEGIGNKNWVKYGKILEAEGRSQMPITKVPVNMVHEIIAEYTLGLFRIMGIAPGQKILRKIESNLVGENVGEVSIPTIYSQIKNKLKEQGIEKDIDVDKFKVALKEELSKIPPEQAAKIVRLARKGVFGAFLYGLAITGVASSFIQFGGYPHKGQYKDDKNKRPDELKSGEISIFGVKLPHIASTIIEHQMFFNPLLMGIMMRNVYHDELALGSNDVRAVDKAVTKALTHLEDGIPQMKFFQNDNSNVTDKIHNLFLPRYQKQEIGDTTVIQNAFDYSDNMKILMGKFPFIKKSDDVMLTPIYNEATKLIKEVKEQIRIYENNPKISEERKKTLIKNVIQQRDMYLKQLRDANKKLIEEIKKKYEKKISHAD